jgi:hypothetical protein
MTRCQHCGQEHEFRCPIIKSVEYFASGKVKRVEYMTPRDYVPLASYTSLPSVNPTPFVPYQPVIPWTAGEVLAAALDASPPTGVPFCG